MNLPVSTLAQAKLVLDRERAELQPSATLDKKLYVKRGDEVFDELLTEAETAKASGRPFQWFYTGHTGAGKSTEINRLKTEKRLTELYIPQVYRVKDSLDINDLDFADLLLAIAQSVVAVANRHEIKIPKDLERRILEWDTEISSEQSREKAGNLKGGVAVEALFTKFSGEIQVGGSQKKTIRQKLRDRLTDFIALINELVASIEKKEKRKVLVILDTLDHVDQKPIRDIFTQHWSSLSRPKVSLLIVAPLFIIHMQELMAEVQDNYTLLPNIRITSGPDTASLDKEGFKFFKEVISRLASLDLFTASSLEAIFRLSGGMLRDMIGIAGDACRHADRDDPEGQVQPKHVQKVFDTRVAHFRRLLSKSDYKTLQEIADNPHPLGIDGMAALLHLKAILYFPNGEGWYEVHPAVKAILDKASASASK